MDMIGLINTLAFAAPDLRNASCRGQHQLFDQAAERHAPASIRERAVDICKTCPALSACATWEEGLRPYQRPAGIVAARRPPSHTARAGDDPPRRRGPRP